MARPPEQLGSLRLVRQLGVGRKCQIWEAADESRSKRVAVKLVPQNQHRTKAYANSSSMNSP